MRTAHYAPFGDDAVYKLMFYLLSQLLTHHINNDVNGIHLLVFVSV